jgi:putative endonuclease
MFFVYILRSERDKQLYTGFTTSIEQRLHEHNAGKVPSTKNRVPLQMIFFEAYCNKDDALRREKYFKTTAGKRGLKLMLRTTLEENSDLFPKTS